MFLFNFVSSRKSLHRRLCEALTGGAACAAILSLGLPAFAGQSSLAPGDIVFVQASADAPDTFAFSPLVNLEAGTVIHFSDEARLDTNPTAYSSWRLSGNNGPGSFGEGVYSWVAPANISAGTVISIDATVHGLGFSTSGENVMAFQGTLYRPQFIAAAGWDSTDPFVTTGVPAGSTTYLPSSLTIGTSAIEKDVNGDNTAYTLGTTSGTKAALQSAVNTASSWTIDNAALVSPPASLTVTGAVNAAPATTVVAGYTFGVDSTTYTQAPTVEPLPGLDLSSISTVNLTGTLDASGGNGFNTQDLSLTGGWSTAASPSVLTDQALEFSVTIAPGQQFDLSHISFTAQTVLNGPQSVALFVSTDGFATSSQVGSNLALSGTNWGVFDFTDSALTQYTGTLTYRIFAFGATTGAEKLELDEIWIDGQVTAVPEPASILLAGMSMIGFTAFARRRRS